MKNNIEEILKRFDEGMDRHSEKGITKFGLDKNKIKAFIAY